MVQRSNSGFRPSPYDGRDYTFNASDSISVPAANSLITLPHPFPARAQGDVPCCVSMAIVGAMETLDAQYVPAIELSPLFHYYVARPDRRWLSYLSIRDGLQTAVSYGVCRSQLHTPLYTREGAQQAPSQQARDDARNQRLVGYDPSKRRLAYWLLQNSDAVSEWKHAIASRLPIVAGLWITAGYWQIGSGSTLVHPNTAGQPSEAGHAVSILERFSI